MSPAACVPCFLDTIKDMEAYLAMAWKYDPSDQTSVKQLLKMQAALDKLRLEPDQVFLHDVPLGWIMFEWPNFPCGLSVHPKKTG